MEEEKRKKHLGKELADAKMGQWEWSQSCQRTMIMLTSLKQTILEFQENFESIQMMMLVSSYYTITFN